jgi:hypothetical protein
VAGVADSQQRVTARLNSPRGVGAVERLVGRANRERAAVEHCVTRVDGQVEDDLLDRARICLDGEEL